MTPPPSDLLAVKIIYDGDCPFCQAYAKMMRLEQHYKVELINARSDHPIVRDIVSKGYDLDEGMVVMVGEDIYHGDDAMGRMAVMTAKSGILRRIIKWTFSSRWRSRHLYPILRAIRNLTLRLLGHKKINT